MQQNINRTFETKSADDTESLGEAIGRRLKGGEIIELASDLGGGKTTFVRGLVRGVGSSDHVSSPTFTLSKVYETDTLHIHHFDFYRLTEAGIMAQELAELLDDPSNVVLVEWSDIVQDVLPARRLRITLERTKEGEDARHITTEAPASLEYLLA